MRKLGNSDLEVTPLCLGGNVFGWTVEGMKAEQVLDTYVGLGGNFIDTADVYSAWLPGHKGGESEELLGRWLKARGNRNEIVLVTKVGSRMGSGAEGLSREHIAEGVEDSLRRLQTDYIDLYLAHRDDQNTPLEETLEAFSRLVQEGKVRYIGASNYKADRLLQALEISDKNGFARYVALQPKYNLVARDDYEGELEELARRENLGVFTYSSLASGFLSGKYRRGEQLPGSARANGVQSNYMNDRGFAVLDAVEQVAREHGATPSQVALAYVMARPGITAPIASATTAEQVQELMSAISLQLTAEDVAALEAAGR